MHHLAPAQVIDFVNGALTVARHAVLINDLRRSPLHLALVYAGMQLFRSPISRMDGLGFGAPGLHSGGVARVTEQHQRDILGDSAHDICFAWEPLPGSERYKITWRGVTVTLAILSHGSVPVLRRQSGLELRSSRREESTAAVQAQAE